MDKLFINVASKQGATNYKTTYVGDSRDTSRDNQIAFLKSTGEIVTRGTVFGTPAKVNDEKFTIDTTFKYNLSINENGEIEMVKYKESSAVGSTTNCTQPTSGGGQYLWGSSYTLSAQTVANNTITCTVTTNGNYCTILSAKNGNSYIFGGSATLNDGVAQYDDTTLTPPEYSKNATVVKTHNLVSGDPGYSDDAEEKTASGIMSQSSKTTEVSSIATRTFTMYWHEKGTNTIKSTTATINGKNTSVTAYPQCKIYYSTGIISYDETTGMLVSTATLSSINCDSNTGSKPSSSESNAKQVSFGQGYHFIAFPHSFGALRTTWSGYEDTSWALKSSPSIKLVSTADNDHKYQYDIYVYQNNGVDDPNVKGGDWLIWWV